MTLTPEKHTLILAPMADLTHAGFRVLIEHYGGCDLYYSEMIDARLYLQQGPLEQYYESTLPDPKRLIFQLVGSVNGELIKAAQRLSYLNPLGIDINMGCSAPHIIKSGAGCAMMNDGERVARLMEGIRKILPPSMLLSAKIRLGEKEDGEKLIRFGQTLEAAGVDYIVLHPKTQKDKSLRPPRKDFIGLLQRELNIPVIANGHIWSSENYFTCWNRQKPSGTMIGRQAARQPWFFSRLKAEIDSTGTPETKIKRIKINLEECWHLYYEKLREYQPREYHKSRAQRFSAYFSENLLYGHTLHAGGIRNCRTAAEMNILYMKYFREHEEERIVLCP